MKKPKPLRKLDKIKRHYDKQKGLCPLCNKPLETQLREYEQWIATQVTKAPSQKKRMEIDLSIDHIIPVSKGGKNKNSNKQLVHSRCNYIKADQVGFLFIEERTPDIYQFELPIEYLKYKARKKIGRMSDKGLRKFLGEMSIEEFIEYGDDLYRR